MNTVRNMFIAVLFAIVGAALFGGLLEFNFSNTPRVSAAPETAGPFTLTVNTPTEVVCVIGDINCKFAGVIHGVNRLSQPIYSATIWSTGGLYFFGFDTNWTNGTSISSVTMNQGEGFTTYASFTPPQTVGTYYVNFYADAKSCNQNTTPWDCVYNGGSQIAAIVHVVADPAIHITSNPLTIRQWDTSTISVTANFGTDPAFTPTLRISVPSTLFFTSLPRWSDSQNTGVCPQTNANGQYVLTCARHGAATLLFDVESTVIGHLPITATMSSVTTSTAITSISRCTPVSFTESTNSGTHVVTVHGGWYLTVRSNPTSTLPVQFFTQSLDIALSFVQPTGTVFVWGFPPELGGDLCGSYTWHTAPTAVGIVVEPDEVSATLPQGGKATKPLTIQNMNPAEIYSWNVKAGQQLPSWLKTSQPVSGYLMGNESVNIPVVIDTAGLKPGTYTYGLALETTDPNAKAFSVPVVVKVLQQLFLPVIFR